MSSHSDIWDTALQLAAKGEEFTVTDIIREVDAEDESEVRSVLAQMVERGWLQETSDGFTAGNNIP